MAADSDAKHSVFRTASAMETTIAVATMAALAALPMTNVLGWLPMTFLQVHELAVVPAALATKHFPTGISQFKALFCCWIAFSLLRFHLAQARFYRWFKQSDISPARTRGFGYFGCKVFGLFRAPPLTQFQFHICCFLMALCLVVAACPLENSHVTRACLLGALVLYVLYFSQLFCESRAGGHCTIIIPLVLIHLICAGETGRWSIFLLKMHIAGCYFSAGYGKLIVSVKFQKFWGDGTALQYLFFESMWSRPGGKLSQVLQEFVFRRLWVNRFLSIFTMLFQLSVPLALLDLRLSWLLFVLTFGFHAGILVTTNISFMHYWVPALLIFLFPHGSTPYDGAWESAAFAMKGAWDDEPIGVTCVCAYLLVQTIVTFSLLDLTYGDILPASCEPMFVLPRSLHDQWPKLLIMSSADPSEAGHLEPYVHCSFNPISKVFPMTEDAMQQLPSKTLIFLTLKSIPPEIAQVVRKDVEPTPFCVWSNVAVDEQFLQLLKEVAHILNDAAHPACNDPQKLDHLIRLQHQCASAFQRACLQEPAVFGFGPLTQAESTKEMSTQLL